MATNTASVAMLRASAQVSIKKVEEGAALMTETVEQDLKSQLGLLRTVNALKNLIARSRYAT